MDECYVNIPQRFCNCFYQKGDNLVPVCCVQLKYAIDNRLWSICGGTIVVPRIPQKEELNDNHAHCFLQYWYLEVRSFIEKPCLKLQMDAFEGYHDIVEHKSCNPITLRTNILN